MIQIIAGTSDRRHKSLPLPLSQEDDAWCRPRFSAIISLCQAGGKAATWCLTIGVRAGAPFAPDPVDAGAQSDPNYAPRLMIIEDSQSAQSGGYARGRLPA